MESSQLLRHAVHTRNLSEKMSEKMTEKNLTFRIPDRVVAAYKSPEGRRQTKEGRTEVEERLQCTMVSLSNNGSCRKGRKIKKDLFNTTALREP